MDNKGDDPLGDAESFDSNWRKRPETQYLHWTREKPRNQIQLAFRRHWLTFQKIIGDRQGRARCLEVGCGRGSLSAYFADHGWDCSLLDLSSTAIDQAKKAFTENDLQGEFKIGNCLQMPYDDSSFDLVFSIGLLEHFEDIESVISEQHRVLDRNGLFIGYVVPHIPDNCQIRFEWVNELLRKLLPNETSDALSGKSEVFRSDSLSPPYLKILEKLNFYDIGHSGIYPLPLISHSPEFPFSLLPEEAELSLVETFQKWLISNEINSDDPWLCEEGEGQAFIIWGRKK